MRNHNVLKLFLFFFMAVVFTMTNLVRVPSSLRHCDGTNIVYHSGVNNGDEVRSSSGLNQSEIINAENMHYTWIGNQWVPPDGVPIYSVTKMRAVYERHNIAWIGDSTCRRAYMTLLGMMNASDPSDVSISEINSDQVIDHGKKNRFGGCTKHVTHPWANDSIPSMKNDSTPSMKKCAGTIGNSKMHLLSPGVSCFDPETTEFASAYLEHYGKKTSQDYDVLIVAMGIWEIVRSRDCRKESNETDAGKRLQMALKSLSNLASPKLRVIWRTIGFSQKHASSKDTIKGFNQIAKEFIEAQPHMSYVDWGGEIERRSFGKERIEGDMSPHYGLEARTLMANMLTHEVASL
jgi:hypothetical protein